MSLGQPADIEVLVTRFAHGEGLSLPAYQSAAASGMDLLAAIDEEKGVLLAPGERATIPTGIAIALPQGYEAQVRPRSGLAQRHGVTVLNAPGTVDADYRGEIKVLLVNLGSEPVAVGRGERIAQLVIQPVTRGILVEVDTLDLTARGASGFGSTGS